jgi:penicillin-binding protein 1A
MGRDDARPIAGLQGGTAPARAFHDFMTAAVANRPVEQFETQVPMPDWQLTPEEELFGDQAVDQNSADQPMVDENGNPIPGSVPGGDDNGQPPMIRPDGTGDPSQQELDQAFPPGAPQRQPYQRQPRPAYPNPQQQPQQPTDGSAPPPEQPEPRPYSP